MSHEELLQALARQAMGLEQVRRTVRDAEHARDGIVFMCIHKGVPDDLIMRAGDVTQTQVDRVREQMGKAGVI